MLEDLKSFLNFTWDDPLHERRIQLNMESSIQYLNSVAGVEIDFEKDQLARDLLFNRVLYMDAQALSDFGNNYVDLLNELKIKYEVKTEAVQ